MRATDIDRSFVHERIKTRGDAFQRRRGLVRVFIISGGITRECLIYEIKFSRQRWHFGRRNMAGIVSESREGHFIRCAATLVINAKRISPRKRRRDAVINEKWERSPEPGHLQSIFAGSFETGKVRFENILIAGKWKSGVRALNEFAAEDLFSGRRVDDFKRE